MSRSLRSFSTRSLLLFSLFGGLLSVSQRYAVADNVVQLVSVEAPPYYGEALPDQGFVSTIIRESFAVHQHRVEISFFPWKRALYMVESGRADGIFTIWYRDDRAKWLNYSTPLYVAETVFLKPKSLIIDYRGLQSLKGYSIAYVLGYAYPQPFYDANLRLQHATTDVGIIQRLINHQTNLAIIDRLQGLYLLKTMIGDEYLQYDALEPPIEKAVNHLAIAKSVPQSDQLIRDFDDGYQQLLSTGRVTEIVKEAGYWEFYSTQIQLLEKMQSDH